MHNASIPEMEESVKDLSQAMKLLAATCQWIGHLAHRGNHPEEEKMMRDIAQVSSASDRALQRLMGASVEGYPEVGSS
jgi:hypothetical protein